MIRRLKHIATVCVIGVLSVGMVACGGTASTSSQAAKSSPATKSGKAAPTVTVKSGVLGSYFGAAVIIAKQEGYFKKYGLNVKYIPFQTGRDARNALLSGSINLSIIGFNPFVLAAAQDSHIEGLAVGSYYGKGESIVVRNDEKNIIKTPADLKGKKIGLYLGSGTANTITTKVLPYYGVHKGQYTVVDINLDNLVAAMSSKQIDAFAASDPVPVQAEIAGVGTIMMNLSKWDPSPGIVTGLKPWINAHPNAVLAYLKGIAAADKLYHTNIQKASNDVRTYLNTVDNAGLSKKLGDQLITHTDANGFFMPTMDQFLTGVAKSNIKNGKMKAVPNWSTFLNPTDFKKAAAAVGFKNPGFNFNK